MYNPLIWNISTDPHCFCDLKFLKNIVPSLFLNRMFLIWGLSDDFLRIGVSNYAFLAGTLGSGCVVLKGYL